MTLNVRCLLCYEILECNQQENINLIEHIKEKHPDVKLTRIPEKQSTPPLFMGMQNDIIQLKKLNPDTNGEKTNDNTESKNIEQTMESQQLSKSDCHKSTTATNANIKIKPSISSMLANLSDSLSHNTINAIENDPIEISICKCSPQSKKSNKPNKTNVWSTLYNTNNNNAHPKLPKLTEKNQNVLNSIYKRKFKPKKPIIPKLKEKRHKLYKTSVEKWRPGTSEITCPNCGITKCPKIRQHSSRVSRSIIGATLILSCWPFCFLPCLFPPPTEELLHCSLCNYYLGTYDSLNGLIIPNILCKKSNRNNNSNVKIENN